MPRPPDLTHSRLAFFDLLDALAEYGRTLRGDEHAEAPRVDVRLTASSPTPEPEADARPGETTERKDSGHD